VRTVVQSHQPEAAIGNFRAAEIYGGVVVAEDVADSMENHTRFVLVGRDEAEAAGEGAFTTSIVCAIPRDRPGALLSILQEFSLRTVNLTRLESRPARTGLGRYVFFIDAEGSRARDLPLAAALDAIEQGGIAHVIALGSYRAATQT
jgi:prephenate dehydratase